MKTRLSIVIYLVALLLAYSLWCVMTNVIKIPNYIIPSPASVWDTLWRDKWILTASALNTLFTALLGFTLAVVFGLTVGMTMHRHPMMRRLLMPILISMKATPVVALIPMASMILGVNYVSRLFFAFIVSFLPLVLSTYAGLGAVSDSLRDFSMSVSHSFGTYIRFILLPSAAAHILLGMRITLPLAFVGAVVAEMTGGDTKGLGYQIISASYRMDAARLYLAIAAITILSIATYSLLNKFAMHIYPPLKRRIA